MVSNKVRERKREMKRKRKRRVGRDGQSKTEMEKGREM